MGLGFKVMGLYRGGVTIITPTSVQWYIVTKKK
jgi:hypothetical protein